MEFDTEDQVLFNHGDEGGQFNQLKLWYRMMPVPVHSISLNIMSTKRHPKPPRATPRHYAPDKNSCTGYQLMFSNMSYKSGL